MVYEASVSTQIGELNRSVRDLTEMVDKYLDWATLANDNLARIADALERLIPEPAEFEVVSTGVLPK